MMRRVVSLMMLAMFLVGSTQLSAHDDFRIIGTVEKFQNSQLDVKTKEGKTVSIALDKQTVITRDKKKVEATVLKKGLSVVVDALGDSDEDLLAIDVLIVPPIAPARAK